MRSEGLGADNCPCQRAVRVMPVKNALQSRWDQTLEWAHTDFSLAASSDVHPRMSALFLHIYVVGYSAT